jgi:hypothetical protein
MVLIYAIISPFTALLGALYFLIKYVVDKYLLTIVYPKEYESSGEISSIVLRLAVFTIGFQQAILIGLFLTTLNRGQFFLALSIFVILQIALKIAIYFVDVNWFQEKFR